MKCRQATGNLRLFRRKFETGIIPTEPGTEEEKSVIHPAAIWSVMCQAFPEMLGIQQRAK